jgi:hypothetical protein
MTTVTSPQWIRVTRLSEAPSWLQSALATVRRLAELPANWDGYGSPALPSRVVERATQLLTFLEWDELPVPQIGPVSGGGIQIEWHVADRELEIEILPDGSVEFLTVEGEAMHEGPLTVDRPDLSRALVRWVMGGS